MMHVILLPDAQLLMKACPNLVILEGVPFWALTLFVTRNTCDPVSLSCCVCRLSAGRVTEDILVLYSVPDHHVEMHRILQLRQRLGAVMTASAMIALMRLALSGTRAGVYMAISPTSRDNP